MTSLSPDGVISLSLYSFGIKSYYEYQYVVKEELTTEFPSMGIAEWRENTSPSKPNNANQHYEHFSAGQFKFTAFVLAG